MRSLYYPIGYLKNKNNLLYELNEYIKEYDTIIGIKNKNDRSKSIYKAILHGGYKIEDLVNELGYDINVVRPVQIKIYDKENLIKTVNEFIKEHNRFPTNYDFRYTLGINSHVIKKFGGINGIKGLVNWSENDSLRDDNGWYNKSAYEYITAQYLIHNNIPYKREQHPFPYPDSEYRSDFMFELADGTQIHVELWGMEGSDQYDQKRKKKTDLYVKYNIPLISLDYSIFTQSYERLQNDLYDIFSKYFNLKFKSFDYEKIVPTVKMTDEEILNALLEHSKDGETLPTVKYLKKNHIYTYYWEVIKRYNGYYNFAAKFGKKVGRVDTTLNKDSNRLRLFDVYLKMINEFGKIPSEDIIRKRDEYKIVRSIERQYDNRISARLDFYRYCIENNIKLSDTEIEYLFKIFDDNNKNISRHATQEQKDQAKQLLELYNKTFNKEVSA